MKQLVTFLILGTFSLACGSALFNQAYQHTLNGNYIHALELYVQLNEQLPNNEDVLYNMAFVLKKLNKMEQAVAIYQHLPPKLERPSKHLRAASHAYLALGDFEHGWQAYEYRWVHPPYYNQEFKEYIQSGGSLANKTVLIKTEYGLGDTLQFIRYAKVVKELGAHVVVESQKPLVKLLSLCPYIDKVIPVQSKIPHFDFQILLMSLPLVFNTRANTIPAPMPYLYASDYLINIWANRLAHDDKFKIGICWQADVHANSTLTTVQIDSKEKSIPLKMLAQLTALENVSIYSLQKINGLDQFDQLSVPTRITRFDERLDTAHGPFMDTAALIKNLDLVITIDTSIAHLAGGLGVTTWVLLPYSADWRWLLDRADSPWYPSMRLFRQSYPGDWQDLIDTVKKELHPLLSRAS